MPGHAYRPAYSDPRWGLAKRQDGTRFLSFEMKEAASVGGLTLVQASPAPKLRVPGWRSLGPAHDEGFGNRVLA